MSGFTTARFPLRKFRRFMRRKNDGGKWRVFTHRQNAFSTASLPILELVISATNFAAELFLALCSVLAAMENDVQVFREVPVLFYFWNRSHIEPCQMVEL